MAQAKYVNSAIRALATDAGDGLDLRDIDALRSRLASDMTGTLQHAVKRMEWRLA
jgi:hypothetical protein